jgi:hypothetical protein
MREFFGDNFKMKYPVKTINKIKYTLYLYSKTCKYNKILHIKNHFVVKFIHLNPCYGNFNNQLYIFH